MESPFLLSSNKNRIEMIPWFRPLRASRDKLGFKCSCDGFNTSFFSLLQLPWQLVNGRNEKVNNKYLLTTMSAFILPAANMQINTTGPQLTVEDYAGVGDSHGVHSNARVVPVVFFRDVEEDEHRLFTLILYLNAIDSIEEPVRRREALMRRLSSNQQIYTEFMAART